MTGAFCLNNRTFRCTGVLDIREEKTRWTDNHSLNSFNLWYNFIHWFDLIEFYSSKPIFGKLGIMHIMHACLNFPVFYDREDCNLNTFLRGIIKLRYLINAKFLCYNTFVVAISSSVAYQQHPNTKTWYHPGWQVWVTIWPYPSSNK